MYMYIYNHGRHDFGQDLWITIVVVIYIFIYLQRHI